MSRPPYPLEITPVPIQLEDVWAPQPIWMVSRQRKSTVRARIRTPNYVIPGTRVPGKTKFGEISCVYVRLNETAECYSAMLGSVMLYIRAF